MDIEQKVIGDKNIVGGGDVHVEEHHHHYPRTPQGIPLQRPKQADHLVGRKELLKDVLAALQPGKVVTLCGPGGIGKTALASRVAWELSPDGKPPAHFPDGLIFYSFYGRKDVSLAFDHLVRSYSDDAQDNSPETVCHLLANKQALIILDGAEEADDLPAVVRCCGGCGVLITSRKRSDAPGKLLEVKPLDKLPAEKAFRLYSRGTACCAPTTADEATVQAICKRLGGWPLALRIAGHYLRNTGESAAEYLRWLEKQPFRKLRTGEHQEEDAALLLERSVAQVSSDAVQVLRVAGVLAFAPISLMPVTAVLHKEDEEQDDLELRSMEALGELVRYGLLERRGERWQISHALVHTYARNEETLSKDALERLAGWYIDFCKTQSAAGLPGYALLDEERVHCLRLIESCLDRGLWQEVTHLVGPMAVYLERQGYWTERIISLEMYLIAVKKRGDYWNEVQCLIALGHIYWRGKEYEYALRWYEQALPICRKQGYKKEEGIALVGIAADYGNTGKHEQALEQYQQGLKLLQEADDQHGEGITMSNIGSLYWSVGKDKQALQYYERGLVLMRETDDKYTEGVVLNNIANIYIKQDELTKALNHQEQALAIMQEIGDENGKADSHQRIGLTYKGLGDLAKAEKHIVLAVQIAEQSGHPSLQEYRDGLEQVRAKRQGA